MLMDFPFYFFRCELFCPFGYVDDVCHTEPIPDQICVCPTDQMICDHSKGCLCKENSDCGRGLRLNDLTQAIPLLEQDQDSQHGATVAIVLSVLFLAITTIVLIAIYYRRRMNRLKSDLQNRSVYYVENSILDPGRHQHHDVVITDRDPLDDDFAITSGGDPAIAMANRIANNMPNNTTLSLAKHEKNVNIDRFKLGQEQEPSTSAGGGACALPEDDEEDPEEIFVEPLETKNLDINVFSTEESPSKVKNNFFLEKQEKVNKPNVDLVFNRNNFASAASSNANDNGDEQDEEHIDEDEIAIAKMTSYLRQ